MTTSTTVTEGTTIPGFRVPAVDVEKMKTMAALLADPNPIHFDLDVVRELGLGDQPVNQGPTNLAWIMNALLAWTGGGPEGIRRIAVRFAGNVFGGDDVTAAGEVVGVEEVDGATIATCDVWLDRADGTRLLAGTAEVDVTGLHS